MTRFGGRANTAPSSSTFIRGRKPFRRRALIVLILVVGAFVLLGMNLYVTAPSRADHHGSPQPSLRMKNVAAAPPAIAALIAAPTTAGPTHSPPLALVHARRPEAAAPPPIAPRLAPSPPTPAVSDENVGDDLQLLDFECPKFDEMLHIRGCQIQCAGGSAGCSNAQTICTQVEAQNSCTVATNSDQTWATLKSLQYAHRPEQGDLQYLVKGQSPDAAVEMIRTWGWKDSTLRPSTHQSHPGYECFDVVGTCSGHGENLLGKCFCIPGWTGTTCNERVEDELVVPCTNKDDECFLTKNGGVFIVSIDRWHAAQEAELGVWSSGGMKSLDPKSGDRIAEHMHDFNHYKDVGEIGSDLGVFLEVGSGPWTQSLPMLREREFTVTKYVLLEPGALDYNCNVETCVYKGGRVKSSPELDGKVVVISAGGEHLDLFRSTFDTIMMVNVLEHVLNGVRILRELFNALKPGGVLIFNDRWWDEESRGSSMTMDVLFHPIRMHKAIFDSFLSGFTTLYRRTSGESKSFQKGGHKYKGVYFIGRKKTKAELCSSTPSTAALRAAHNSYS